MPSALENPLVFPEDIDAAVEDAVPLGGTTGQVLEKTSNGDHDTAWTSDLRNITSIGSPDYVQFDITATGVVASPGRMYWNDGDGTLDLDLKGGNVTLQVGQEEVVRVFNDTVTAMSKGQVVYVTGAQGNRPSVQLADADAESTSSRTLGVVAEPIPAGEEGFIVTAGLLHKLNLPAPTWTEGSAVWLSPTTPGSFTMVKPQAPNHAVLVGWIVRTHANQGSLFVHISNGWELDELHDVQINQLTLADGEVLSWDNTAGVWRNSQGVAAAVAALVDSAPTTLNTLNELAAALGDDPNFATTVSTALGLRARTDQGNTFTGAQLFQSGAAGTVPVVARGVDGQTANLFELKQTTAGPVYTNRFTVSNAGYTTTVNFQADGGIRVGSGVSYTTNRNWVSIGNTSVAPATPATGGGILFVEGGLLKFQGTTGGPITLGSGGGGNEVRSDVVSGVSYMGVAPTGSAESDAVWKITRIDTTVDPITITTATNVKWDDRLTAVYS